MQADTIHVLVGLNGPPSLIVGNPAIGISKIECGLQYGQIAIGRGLPATARLRRVKRTKFLFFALL